MNRNKEKTLISILGFVGYLALTMIMISIGYGITTWQFWAIGLITIGQYTRGIYEAENR